MVKRFDAFDSEIYEQEDGDFVQYEDYAAIKSELDALRERARWRDAREELPRENLPVLVSYKSIFMSEVQSVAILFDGVEWRQLIGGSKFSDAKVTHWMPLPTPPTSQSNKD